jgi:hypothetical protein
MKRDSHHSSQPLEDELLFSLQRHECPRCGGTQCRKPIIRVVCPVCASIVAVNALDREGVTETYCSKCEPPTTISISTDEYGCITDIQGWQTPVEKKKKPEWIVILLGAIAVLLLLNFIYSIASSSSRTEPIAAPVGNTSQPSQPPESVPPNPVQSSAAAGIEDGAGVTRGQTEPSPTPKATPGLDLFAPDEKPQR